MSDSKISHEISEAFADFSESTFKEKGKAYTFDWYTLSNGNFIYFLRVATTADSILILKGEVDAYKRIWGDADKNTQLLTAFCPIIRYAKSKAKDNAEVLHGYAGIPINSLWEKIKDDNQAIRVQFMMMILRDSIQKLKNANIVHGCLSPDNILFDDNQHSLRFLGIHSARTLDSITSTNKFKTSFINIYTSLTYPGKIIELFKDQAITADIKALALSVYEMGMPSIGDGPKTINDPAFLVNGRLDLSKLMTYENHILNKSDSSDAKKFLDTIKFITSTSKDLSFDDVLKMFPNGISPECTSAETFKISQECPIPFKTDLKLNVPLSKIKIKRFGKFGVYLVEDAINPNNPAFDSIIVKVGTQTQLLKEIKVYEHLKKYKDLFALTKTISNIISAPNELVIEYGGLNFANRLKYAAKNADTLSHILNMASNIIKQINEAKFFHGDIKPFSMKELCFVYLLDYIASHI